MGFGLSRAPDLVQFLHRTVHVTEGKGKQTIYLNICYLDVVCVCEFWMLRF